MSTIVGMDLGSRRVGVVVAPEALPLQVLDHRVVAVSRDLTPAVGELVALAVGARRVVLEHAPFYAPSGKSPAALASMAQAHEVASILEARLRLELEALGIEVITMPRATWSHRVVPHTRGGITDLMARAGLEVHVDPESWAALAGQDEIDAAGAIVGVLFPAPPRTSRPRRDRRKKAEPKPPLPPEVIEARRCARRAYKTEWQAASRGGRRRDAKAASIAAAVARGPLLPR